MDNENKIEFDNYKVELFLSKLDEYNYLTYEQINDPEFDFERFNLE